MPKVGKAKFPYTKEGMEEAEKQAKKRGFPMKKGKAPKKGA